MAVNYTTWLCHTVLSPLSKSAKTKKKWSIQTTRKTGKSSMNTVNNASCCTMINFYVFCILDPTMNPHHYNSKLMNSIWGMYNRYSVHNFKKNMDANGKQLPLNQHSWVLMSINSLFGLLHVFCFYRQGVGSFSSTDKLSVDLGGGKSSLHVAKKLLGAPDSANEIKKKYMYA